MTAAASDMKGCWYAVCCKPRQESVAQENLLRQGYRVYLPRLQARKRRGGQWVETIEALFPRYLFIRVDANARSVAPVRSTRGACGLVRFGSQPAVVPDEVIDAIKEREDAETGMHRERRCEFRSGDQVKLITGPLAGVEGIFSRHSSEERVLVLLELLGKANHVAVARDWIDKAA